MFVRTGKCKSGSKPILLPMSPVLLLRNASLALIGLYLRKSQGEFDRPVTDETVPNPFTQASVFSLRLSAKLG